jgi:hypothetical protein
MEELCRNCQHFEDKGLMMDKDMWGLCIKFKRENTGNRNNSALFRWGDDICEDFSPRYQPDGVQQHTE